MRGCQTARMAPALTFVSQEMVHFWEHFTWVNLKYFAIQPTVSDALLLTHLIANTQYQDHYAGQDPAEQPLHLLHGPYRLNAITPDTFQAVSIQTAGDDLRGWVSSWAGSGEDGPELEAKLSAAVIPRVVGDAIYRLPDLRQSAEHEWGSVVGQDGFHELVIIDRAAEKLTLLVASDD